MQYRRANVTGGTYFFTVNLANRKNTLLIDEFDKLRIVINKVKKQHPFKLEALVILPDHLHAIWTLPVHDNDYAKRWMLIKAGFSRYMPNHEKISVSRKKKGERGIWQRRYWEHLIHDEDDYEKHVNYIHHNPVKHGYVNKAIDWPYSTIHDYIEKGILTCDVGHEGESDDEPFGEII